MKTISGDEALFVAFRAILLDIGPVNAASMIAGFCDATIEQHDCPEEGGCALVKHLSALSADLHSVVEKYTLTRAEVH
jgi:hypothetical protein